MQQSYDVVIIGGGVVGSAIARELSRYKLRIAVLEKESDVCTQTSGRNTGMLHAGFLYKTGSLKAICAVEGNQEFDQVARELDVPFKRTGKLIVGFTDEHRLRLEQFMARGEANGVKGLELIDRKRMDELDPSAGGNFAMWCPASGILDPFLYTIAGERGSQRGGVPPQLRFHRRDPAGRRHPPAPHHQGRLPHPLGGEQRGAQLRCGQRATGHSRLCH